MITSTLPDYLPVFAENLFSFVGENQTDIVRLNGIDFEVFSTTKEFEINLSDIAKHQVDINQEEGPPPTLLIEIDSLSYSRTHYLLAGSERQEDYPNLSYHKYFGEGYPYQYPHDYKSFLQEGFENYPLFISKIKDNKLVKGKAKGTKTAPCNAVYLKWLNSLGGISHHAFKFSKEETKSTRKYFKEFLDTPKKNESIVCYDHISEKEKHIFESLLTSRRILIYENNTWVEVGVKSGKVEEKKNKFISFKFEIIKKELEF